jgi:hypothetical protein
MVEGRLTLNSGFRHSSSTGFDSAAWADCVVGLHAGGSEEEEGDDAGELHVCKWKRSKVCSRLGITFCGGIGVVLSSAMMESLSGSCGLSYSHSGMALATV